MKATDFAKLFPEIPLHNRLFHNLKELCLYKKLDFDELTFCLHDFSLLRLNYKGYSQNPSGYLWRVVNHAIIKDFKNNRIDYDSKLTEDEIYEFAEFDRKSTKEKLNDFLRKIRNSRLSPNELRLAEIMIDLSENDHDCHRDFMDEVKSEAAKLGVNYDNFRKIHQRLREQSRGNSGLRGSLMSFIPRDTTKEVKEFMEYLLGLG